jgi:hypothetical protein
MQVDLGRTAADYARYRAGFPALLEVPRRLWAMLGGKP